MLPVCKWPLLVRCSLINYSAVYCHADFPGGHKFWWLPTFNNIRGWLLKCGGKNWTRLIKSFQYWRYKYLSSFTVFVEWLAQVSIFLGHPRTSDIFILPTNVTYVGLVYFITIRIISIIYQIWIHSIIISSFFYSFIETFFGHFLPKYE